MEMKRVQNAQIALLRHKLSFTTVVLDHNHTANTTKACFYTIRVV